MTMNPSGYLENMIGPVVLEVAGVEQDARPVINFAGCDAAVVDDTLTITPNLANKTLASPTITGTVIYQGTKLRILSIPGEITTGGNGATAVASFVMLDETLCAFDVVVTAARKPSVTKGGRWKRSVVYRRTGGGAATIVGTLETGTDQETDAALDVTIDHSVNTVRVIVTGLAATDINWTCELRVQETLGT